MNKNKSDYRRGLIYFSCLMICICLFLTTPDGDMLLYKFLGLFGISPGIQLSDSETLYIYALILLIAVIVCVKKLLTYWQYYRVKFKDYNILLRFLPIFIAIPVFLVSTDIVSPSVLDRVYYGIISQRHGLRSITYYASENECLNYKFKGTLITYSYNLTFENHSHETVKFNVKLTPDQHDGFKEMFIKDDKGELKVFSLPPNEIKNFKGEFAEQHQTENDSGQGIGEGTFLVVLSNDEEQYSTKPIMRNHLTFFN